MPDSLNHRARARLVVLLIVGAGSAALRLAGSSVEQGSPVPQRLSIRQDQQSGTLSVFRAGTTQPVLTQNAPADHRPYLHPIVAPDGRGVLTEYSPGHHPHQTGLYWGFTRLNGRDYFHNPKGDYWRRVSAEVLPSKADEVQWQTVYDLLDAEGKTALTETQRWTMRERNGSYLLDLEWRGQARTDVTIGRYDYGGLFLRMPWREGMRGEVVNAARQRNERAEGQRAMWIDVGMQVDGRDDLAHIAIFDHPDNDGYPQQWRVDTQLGVGAARSRDADWTIARGRTEVVRHQFVVYTGTLDDVALTSAWATFSGDTGQYLDRAAVGARPEGRSRSGVPDARTGGGPHDHAGRLYRGRVGRRTGCHPADGVLLGRPRAAVGGGES